VDDNPDNFIPGPFLPQGIDSENEIPDNMGETPFAPLPLEPAFPPADPDAPPELNLEEPPSPFAPLPSL
jgi:hypothetical protein